MGWGRGRPAAGSTRPGRPALRPPNEPGCATQPPSGHGRSAPGPRPPTPPGQPAHTKGRCVRARVRAWCAPCEVTPIGRSGQSTPGVTHLAGRAVEDQLGRAGSDPSRLVRSGPAMPPGLRMGRKGAEGSVAFEREDRSSMLRWVGATPVPPDGVACAMRDVRLTAECRHWGLKDPWNSSGSRRTGSSDPPGYPPSAGRAGSRSAGADRTVTPGTTIGGQPVRSYGGGAAWAFCGQWPGHGAPQHRPWAGLHRRRQAGPSGAQTTN